MTLRTSPWAPPIDAAVAVLSVYLAYRLRFDPSVRDTFLPGAERSALLAAVLMPVMCGVAGLYRRPLQRLWPIRLMVGTAVAFAAALGALWAFDALDAVSRFAFAAAALLTTLSAGAWRAGERLRELWLHSRAPALEPRLEDRSGASPSLATGLMRLLRSRELIRNLVWKELKLKYRGSVLGFVWSLLNPLLMLLVYSLAFNYILGIRRPAFVYSLLIGMLAWTFFASTTAMATGSIVDGAGLLKSVRFPRAVLPLSTALFNLAQYLMTFAVLLPVMLIAFRITPSWTMMAFPIVLILMVLFTLGVALTVAAAATYFRDVKHLVEVALAVLFWTTPIIYDLESVPERLRLPILLSPMSPFVTALHDLFYQRAWPDLSIWVTAIAWSAAAFVCGLTIFLSFEDRFAEQL